MCYISSQARRHQKMDTMFDVMQREHWEESGPRGEESLSQLSSDEVKPPNVNID